MPLDFQSCTSGTFAKFCDVEFPSAIFKEVVFVSRVVGADLDSGSFFTGRDRDDCFISGPS